EVISQIIVEIDTNNKKGESAELFLFYNHPSSGSTYEPVVLQILPLGKKWRENLVHLPWPPKNLPEIIGGGGEQRDPIDDMNAITLRAFIREYFFVSIFRACAESLASENASRLAAMQRADKNIEDLLGNLNGEFHRFRQAEIDEELFDVVAGFEILGDGH
ncbi:MAG: F0F1 ATP synthase subunit gamma, partial [Bdellovibrio sp. CG10_big_fil_rev_8_21_14_0_10_47_8]